MKLTLFNLITIIFPILFFSCTQKEAPSSLILTEIGSRSISVPEPSGLEITYDRSGFWTVSDENSTVYKLDSEGNVVQKIIVDGTDLEGIAVIDERRIAVVLERSRIVVILDTAGNELNRKQLPLQGEVNSGIEGISYNSENHHFYILNEKEPSLLIELNEQLEIISMDTLNFSKDVSGIFYDHVNKCLWILSDEDRLVVKANLNGIPIESIKVNVVQPEGIAIDNKGKRLYLVSDIEEAIYIYEMK